jgi:hypothetical protein
VSGPLRPVTDITKQNPSTIWDVIPNFFFLLVDILRSFFDIVLVFFLFLYHFWNFINVIHSSLISLYISIKGPLLTPVLKLYTKIKYPTASELKM